MDAECGRFGRAQEPTRPYSAMLVVTAPRSGGRLLQGYMSAYANWLYASLDTCLRWYEESACLLICEPCLS